MNADIRGERYQGVRTFTIESLDDDTVAFTLREEFSGPMLGMIKGSLPDMTEPFQQFVAGLKERAESQ